MNVTRINRTNVLIIITCLLLLPVARLSADEEEKQDPFQPNAQKAAPAQNPLNPLKKIIQGWFGKPKAAQQANKPAQSKSPDYYRFPQDLEQERRFKSVQQLIDGEQWEAAREKLQLMLENSLNLPVHIDGERSLITDRELIYELLPLLPEEEQEKFTRQYQALAGKLLSDALQNNAAPETYAEIATRFASTPAGFAAMNFLTSYHLERGEFGLAAQYLQRLLKLNAPITRSRQWRTKAAYIFKQTGNEELVTELLQPDKESTGLDESIKIGGAEESPLEWLQKQKILQTTANLMLTEWPMLFGSPNHAARAQAADPLLIPRWSYPLTSNHSIQTQLQLIQEDLTSAQHATIPALPPLAIDGKIIFRTLKGVQVLDSRTGAPLWEAALENSPETAYINAQLKSSKTPQARGLFDAEPEQQSFSPYNGTDPDSHALTSLLFRNANWGSQSSDGRHLFVLESMRLNLGSSGSVRNFNRLRQRGGFETDFWSSNQLVAYDLKTGQPKWKVGGTRFEEPFDLPLAGTFFFGAPTPAENEIYIIGERDREIRVYALDPETGAERWSQQIGNPDQDIELDMVRRWWIAPVAIDQGVIICPTTIGLLTAIDRLNHSILWSTRYEPASNNNNNQRFNHINQTSREPLNQRWCPSAPIISGNKVVYTPQDDETLVCLDLITGSPCWTRRAKESSLYLAGVVDDLILLVGLNGVHAVSMTNGKTVWNKNFDSEAGLPSGQAVIADQRLHVPLQSGQIWTFDVKSGIVLNKLFNPNPGQPLGNLIIYQGQFLSLSAAGLASFEQKQTFEAEIEQLKQQNATAPLVLFKESELLMMSHRYPQALTRLQQIDPAQLPAKHRPQYQSLMIDCLTSMIRSNFQQYDELVQRLKQQVASEQERIELRRLLVERSRARKESSTALDFLLELATAPADSIIKTGGTETQIDCWIAGQAGDLWKQVSPAQREQFNQRISERARSTIMADSETRERFLQQFGFLEASIPVLQFQIKTAMQSERFFEAELWLTRLKKLKSPQHQAEALAGMVQLCEKFNLTDDAIYYLQQLSQYDSSLPVAENLTAAQFQEQYQQKLQTANQKTQSVHWRPRNLKLIVGGSARGYSVRENTLDTSDSSLPFYRSLILSVDPKENRLSMEQPAGNELKWSTPLRSTIQSRSSGFNESDVVGHNLILQHRDMLHFFDLVDRKLIWSQKLEKEQANRYYSSYYRLTPAQLGNESTLVHRHHPSIAIRKVGMIAAANSDYTCYYSRRQIILIDTRTGKVRWTHENVDKETRVLGDDRMIYLVTRDRVTRKILRV
ncbi:MAG: PQQ-binding-like beta-propeller repeat protein, partial [Planctomycetaceae bacterium]|nr:PQQ-binding-like beta-propeller repeat protein [Planctomycetaceae bacterium]